MSLITFASLLITFFLTLSPVQSQCPPNVTTIFFVRDITINVPLFEPVCLGCRFFGGGGNLVTFSDGVWRKGSNPGTDLNDGDFNGNVSISSTSNTIFLTMNYPDAVVDVGDTLTCSSLSVNQQNIVTVEEFIFLVPNVSPNGTVNVTEGSDVTLTCSNPGNTGMPRYVWINDTDDDQLTTIINNPPLTLSLTDVQRAASGDYICRSTNTFLPGVNKDTAITINVQYLDILSNPMTNTIPRGTNYTLTCSFNANPMVSSVIWYHNGTELDPDNYAHISVTDQSTSSQLLFSPLQGLDDSGEYTCSVSNGVINRTRSLLTLTVQVNPNPVLNLMTVDITNTSVRLTWSLGFDGNSARTGGTVSYAAVSNGVGSGQPTFTDGETTEYTINDLQPFTNYSFNVTVNNLVGSSTGVTINTTTVANIPSTPTLDSVVPVNSTALAVTWIDNRDSMTQAAVDNFTIVYYLEGEQQSPQSETVSSPATTVTLMRLSKGTRYTVQVFATNPIGASPSSNTMTMRTNIDPPSAVDVIVLTPYPDSICVSWDPPNDNGGENITDYRISYRNVNTSSELMTVTTGPSTRSRLLNQLDKQTYYEITIAAVNPEGGVGVNTTETRATGSPFEIDTSISLSVSSITALRAQVSWNVVAQIESVRLQYRRLGMEWSRDREVNFSSAATGHVFNNLTSETTYEIRLITLFVSSCEQRTSNTVNFTTIPLEVIVNASNNATTFNAGDQVMLTCNLDTGGAPPTAVMWTYNDGPLPSTARAIGNTLTISSPSVSDSGNYTCSFRDASYTFALTINPTPTPTLDDTSGFPQFAIYAIAGVVAAIIVVFIIILIVVCCCICRKNRASDVNLKGARKASDGMWLDPGGAGFSPTYRHSEDSIDYNRDRSYTNEYQSATSFDTAKKGESQENLTDDKPPHTEPNAYVAHGKPYADQRVEYATVGSSTFSKHSDV